MPVKSDFDGEGDLNIPNYVLTCIIGGHIIFLKEKFN